MRRFMSLPFFLTLASRIKMQMKGGFEKLLSPNSNNFEAGLMNVLFEIFKAGIIKGIEM